MRKRYKVLTLLVLLAMLVGVISGCGNTGTPSSNETGEDENGGNNEVAVEKWEIPVLSTVTGAVAFVGKPAAWAAEYATKIINEQGGIRGVPVEISVYDTQFDTAKAVSYMSSVVDDSIVVVGPPDAPGAESAGQVIADAKVPNIASYSFPDIREQYSPYAIAYMADSEEGDWLAAQRWIDLNPDIESIVIFYDPTDPSQVKGSELLKEMLPSVGVEVLGTAEVNTGQIDAGPSVVQALNKKPDGYFVVLRADEAAKVIMELRKRGVDEGRRIAATFAAYSVNNFDVAKDALDGTYIWNKLDPEYSGEGWTQLVENFKKDNNGEKPIVNPVPDYYNAIIAIKQCFEELEITGNPDKRVEEREAIAQWLRNSPTIDGIQGEYKWEDGKKVAPVYFFQFEGNVPKAIE